MFLVFLFTLSAHLNLKTPEQDLSLQVKIPQSKKEAIIGLSKNKSLKKEEGMLFIHADEDIHLFTMEETSLPLLFLFFDRNFNLVDIQKGEPFQKELIIPSKPCQYVLEAHSTLLQQPFMFNFPMKLQIQGIK